MFVVMYRWQIKDGFEGRFEDCWRQVTEDIRARWGTHGSRLHKADDGTWVAYAQWPSRVRWEEASDSGLSPSPAMLAMRECIVHGETMLKMEVVKDLLGP